MTDSQGAASLYGYEPFGEIADGDGSLTSYAFTGQWKDAATGLQHHRARWYDAGMGRWGSADPVFDWPAGFGNYYAAVGGNPLNVVDASGRNGISVGELLIVAAIIIGVLAVIALPAIKEFMKSGDLRKAGMAASDAAAAFFIGLWILVKQGLWAWMNGDYMWFWGFLQAMVIGIWDEMLDYGRTIGEALGTGRWGLAIFLTIICVASFLPTPDDAARIASMRVGGKLASEAAESGAETVVKRLADAAPSPSRLDGLRAIRRELGLPEEFNAKVALDGKPREVTVGKLEIGDKEYYGMSAWDANKEYAHPFTNQNAATPTHAEGDVFLQAAMDGQFGHKKARFIVDHDLCQNCGRNHGVQKMMKDLQLEELEVVSPSFPDGFTIKADY